jgi:multidrug efflux pump subunit AcrB
MYLTVVDGRLRDEREIAALPIATGGPNPIRLGDVATVTRAATPTLSKVTANGRDSVLLNIYSHPDASTIGIAGDLQNRLREIRRTLPQDVHVEFFYDQSLLVRESMASVWEAIAFGLVLSVLIVFLFLRDWGSTFIATLAIPVSVLFTILAMKIFGLTFNLMTLGGIAAVIGLVIDDAIVVVEAIYAKLGTGLARQPAVRAAIADIFAPLLGSTLTPVVVFIPLAFLDGVSGVFFRALALTMTVALLTSLVLALTLIPSLASWMVRGPSGEAAPELDQARQSGFLLRIIIRLYELTVRLALRHRWFTIGLCGVVLFSVVVIYSKLNTDFLPAMDEGGFVIDYIAPAGTSLTEIDRQLRGVEKVLLETPEVGSYSRRAGEALGVMLVEPNTGDFLVKLKSDRKRSTQEVITDVREKFNKQVPRFQWEFPGILSDLIGDLTWEDQPIEIKLFSTDTDFLKRKAAQIVKSISNVPGVVDITNGVNFTGPAIRLKVRVADAERYGLTAQQIGSEINALMLGQQVTNILEGDRLLNVRVKGDDRFLNQIGKFGDIPLRASDGTIIRLRQVADVTQTPGELELHRDDLRQDIAITANLEGRDMGSAISQLREIMSRDPELTPGSIEFGGLFEQQQEAFSKLMVVLTLAILLVFTVALLEFRSFTAPIAIVFGAALSMFGIVVALKLTGTTVSIVTFLGAIIGMGIVHKNGILMLDYVHQLQERGMVLREALIYAGRRRLRPVLMTCLAAAMGMMPLAYGIGSGADMLRPMAIAVIGAVCISVLLSLIATPTMYYCLTGIREFLLSKGAAGENGHSVVDPGMPRQ